MIPVVKRDVREIPVALLDGPELAMRDGFVDQAFDDLKDSIQVNGIRVPIIVVARSDRFRVVAGDRRYNAAKHLGAVTVPCDVQEIADEDLEIVKVLENEDRQEVNAADAAKYFMRLFTERCGEDIDRVCAMVRRPRRYVEERILLFSGDEKVFDALKEKQISLGVAIELNRIKDLGYRRMNLDQARKYGMTIDAAKDARKQANFATERKEQPGAGDAASAHVDATPAPAHHACYICHSANKPERMRYALVHDFCDQFLEQQGLLVAFRQPPAPGTSDA